ncbi:GAF domain-containing protein [bacterium]|nr:GAF domain-containing protein [bacterium]
MAKGRDEKSAGTPPGGKGADEAMARALAKIVAPGPESGREANLREEIRRLRAKIADLGRASRLAAQMHLWAELLLEGELTRSAVLEEIARMLELRVLLLWRLEDGAQMVLVGQAGSASRVDRRPCGVGRETAGATWAVGRPRVFPDMSMAPTSVQQAVGGMGISLLSIPLRGQDGGWVVEACDHMDGRPLSAQVMEEAGTLVTWLGLARD